MNLDNCIKILTEHSKWRRGEPPYHNFPPAKRYNTAPKELGEAIDFAIGYMNETRPASDSHSTAPHSNQYLNTEGGN